MTEQTPNKIELLLSRALAPVEPPEKLKVPIAERLEKWTDQAADELEGWELSSMRDPRNWARVARPAAAFAVTATAGTALVLIRAHKQSKQQHSNDPIETAERLVRLVGEEARKFFRR
jgi:hypothetical protein